MIKLYTINDRIPIQIGPITIIVAPLSYKDKQILKALMRAALSIDSTMDIVVQASKYAIKSGVKDIKGIVDSKDNEYKLEFEENGTYLTDACVEDLLALPANDELICICSELIHGIPDEMINPLTGKPFKGVKILPMEVDSSPLT